MLFGPACQSAVGGDARPPGLHVDAGCPVDVGEIPGREQLAGDPVEHVKKAVLVRLKQHGVALARHLQFGEDHLLHSIEVPAVVRRGLVVPRQAAAVGMEGNDGRRVQAVEFAGPELAQVVRRRIRGAEIHQVQGGVVGEAVPRRAAAVKLRAAPRIPGLGSRGEVGAVRGRRRMPGGARFRGGRGLTRGGRHGIKAPFELTGIEVIGGDVAANTAATYVRAGVADDDDVAGDLRCTGAGIGQRMVRDGVGFPDLPAGGGVESVEAAVAGRHVDPALPDGDAAVDEVATGIARGRRGALRVVAPDLTAGGRIHCIYVTPGAGGVHDAVDHNGRGLLAPPWAAQIVAPGETQVAHVRRIDRGKGRVIAAARVSSARIPVLRLRIRRQQPGCVDRAGRLRRRGRHGGQREQKQPWQRESRDSLQDRISCRMM